MNVDLQVNEEILVERVVGRRLDPVTGKIYHLKYSPPETEEMLPGSPNVLMTLKKRHVLNLSVYLHSY